MAFAASADVAGSTGYSTPLPSWWTMRGGSVTTLPTRTARTSKSLSMAQMTRHTSSTADLDQAYGHGPSTLTWSTGAGTSFGAKPGAPVPMAATLEATTTRPALAARAASRTRRVPVTFTSKAVCMSQAPRAPAMCTTTSKLSWAAKHAARPAASPMSTCTDSTPSIDVTRRDAPTTVCPALASASASDPPSQPVVPVIKTRILQECL
mmetsp:Transcript_8849/g.29212  ORF Transcript_8849/g.29212 Transcript_8849/m.29212 type:complete len:208 (-) Transcript_8849:54-677(-)